MKDNTINNKIDSIIHKYRILFSILIVIITFLFVWFRADPGYQIDSESLVVGPVMLQINDQPIVSNPFGMGTIVDKTNHELVLYTDYLKNDPGMSLFQENYDYLIYGSSIGLQGFVFRGISCIFKTINVIYLYRLLCCFLLIVTLYFVAILLKRRYGYLFATTFWLTIFISPYLINFSPNLFWVSFTWFIPLLLSLFCINYEDKRKWIYPFYFIAIAVKCMCGYEFLSTVMFSGIVFLLAEWFICKEKRKDLIKCIFISGLCMFIGFIAVAVLHIYLMGNQYCDGSFVDGMTYFRSYLIERRTFGNAESYSSPILAASLNATIPDVIYRYFWEFAYGRIMLFLLITSLVAIFIDRYIFKKDFRFRLATIVLQTLSVLSWLVLAKAHSYIHTHMNFVLFEMGFSAACIYALLRTVLNHISIIAEKADSESPSKYSYHFRFKK